MAFGFTPKHTEELSLNEITQPQFLALAIETASKTGWKVGYTSENGFIAYTDNGMLSWNAEIKITIDKGIATILSASTGSELMDWGKNKKNIAKFIAYYHELSLKFSGEELNSKYEELTDQLVPAEEDVLKLPPATTTEKIQNFFSIFKPTEGYFITPILINLNLLIFILMAVSGVNLFEPDSESLLNWGANFRPLTLEGQTWRLITNCFLHIGIFHLLLNMYALLYIGVILEPILGRARFLTAYLLTGILASITSLWWHELTISAGASGAIFGMYGVFLALLTTNHIEKTARKALLTSIAVFIAFNLFNGLKDGIDNAAHIGGLLSGMVIGYALIPSLSKPSEKKMKFGTIGVLAIVTLLISFILVNKIPNDIGTYDKKIKQFATLETLALEVYNLPENTSTEKYLQSIKIRGLYNWNKNLKLIESFNTLDLPSEIETRNRHLKEYCELRIKSYELLYKAFSENTDQYQTQIENYNKLIEAKIHEIGN